MKNHHSFFSIVIPLAAIIFLAESVPCQSSIKTENFDTDPGARGWTGLLNTSSGNSYGFSPNTSYAGGGNGEAGGVFARLNSLHYYGDTGIGNLSLNNSLFASGKFSVGNRSNSTTSQQIGFFNTANTATPLTNVFNMVVGEPQFGTNTYRMSLRMRLSDASQIRRQDKQPSVMANIFGICRMIQMQVLQVRHNCEFLDLVEPFYKHTRWH